MSCKAIAIILAPFLLGIAASGQEQAKQRNQADRVEQREMTDRNQRRAEMVKNRVLSRLAGSMSLYGSEIDVKTEGDTVTLTGYVRDQQALQRAERIARRTAGVRKVNNQLRVDQAAVDRRRNVNVSDDALARQVAEKIAAELNAETEEDWLFGWEVEDDDWEIEIEADDGLVTLSGDAASYSDMNRAVLAAHKVPGVRAVLDRMTLSWESQRYGFDGRYDYYPYYGPYYGPY